jgi:dCMP deaminase
MATKPTVDDSRWLALCASKGRESPDPKAKVGYIIVGPDRSARCEACNTYPNGVHECIPERTEAPLKYVWTEHAERNAIYLAARRGISTIRA